MVSDYIIIIIEFQYDTQKERTVSNEIRRAFLGLKRSSPNIPKNIQEIVNSTHPLLNPVHFALLKKPEKIKITETKYKLKNPAVGAVIIYEYIGLSQDFETFIKFLNNYLKDLFKEKQQYYLKNCSSYKLIIGKNWE